MAHKKNQAPPQGSEVEEALLRRALGFTQEEVYSEDVLDKVSGESKQLLRRKVVTKTIPPDVRALLFWLKNRMPDKWKERVEALEEDDCDYGFEGDEVDL